jgi:hypothetical protein
MRILITLIALSLIAPEAVLAASPSGHQPPTIRLQSTTAKPKPKPRPKLRDIPIIKLQDKASPVLN